MRIEEEVALGQLDDDRRAWSHLQQMRPGSIQGVALRPFDEASSAIVSRCIVAEI